MLPTKPGESIVAEGDLEILAWLEAFDAEHTAGRPLIIDEMTALEWQCWVLWSNLKQIEERKQHKRIADLFGGLMGGVAGG